MSRTVKDRMMYVEKACAMCINSERLRGGENYKRIEHFLSGRPSVHWERVAFLSFVCKMGIRFNEFHPLLFSVYYHILSSSNPCSTFLILSLLAV